MQNWFEIFRSDKFIFSSFQFFQIGLFAFYIAFLPLYLSDIGLNANQIALQSLLSTFSMMVIGPLVLELSGNLITTRRLAIVLSIISPLLFLLFTQVRNFYAISTIWFLFIGTRIASGTLVDVELLKRNFLHQIRFEKIRLWGSVGFIFIGFILGITTKNYGSKFGVIVVFPVLIVQNILNILIAKKLKDPPKSILPKITIFKILKNQDVFKLFLTVSLSWISHATLYTYLSLYLERLSFTSNQISLTWNIGVISEIILFFCFSFLEESLSLKSILKISLILTSVRWLILYFSQNFYIILASQLLHAFSFGAVLMCSTKLAYIYFPDSIKDKSQGYLSLFGIGMGSLIGRIILTTYPIPFNDYLKVTDLFLISSLVAILALIISCFLPKK